MHAVTSPACRRGEPSIDNSGGPSLTALEDKARRMLKRCRYDDAAKAFKDLTTQLQLQGAEGSDCCSGETMTREIAALEGLAICLSRQLDDAGAEDAQRQALALRCRHWQEGQQGVLGAGSCILPFASAARSARALAAKKAALPCLRNLASFVSNQGRHKDAEVVLRTVLGILQLHEADKDTSDERARERGSVSDPTNSYASDPSTTEITPSRARTPPAGKTAANGVAAAVESAASGSTTVKPDPTHARRDGPTDDGTGVATDGVSAAATLGSSSASSSRQSSPLSRRVPSGASPAPPPPSPATPTKQSGSSISGGGGARSGRLKESSVVVMRLGGGDGDLEDVELEEVGREEEEDAEQMAAVTRHHLAIVIHAQGRVREAEKLLEGSVATLRRRKPPQAVLIAQALHDLAGIIRPHHPARSCALYREALQLLEKAKGLNHFLTAPTLAKLGSLLGDSLVAAAAIPPAPAAPAGPGAAGVARAAGLAEAVCAPGEVCGPAAPGGGSVEAAAGHDWDAKGAEGMIKRAVVIQGRHLGLRHPAVASSLRAMAELYRKQGRLSEADPMFRRAIRIWEASPGPMDADAVAALHGLAHCVLAGAGADWLGRFEEAFALVDQAYRIASSQPGSDLDGSYSSSRLLLEALRMIRSRQRQGRGEPQPASTAIMDGVWNGRWDPAKAGGDSNATHENSTSGDSSRVRVGHVRSSSRGDDRRCAVCLEEVGGGASSTSSISRSGSSSVSMDGEGESGETGKPGSSETLLTGSPPPPSSSLSSSASASAGLGVATVASAGEGAEGLETVGEFSSDIGSEEAVRAETEDAHARGRFAYLPCGHRFHTHCIGRWLVHSSSCPSCRRRVEDDTPDQQPAAAAATAPTGTPSPPAVSGEPAPGAVPASASGGGGGSDSPVASRTRRGGHVVASTRSVATQARADDPPREGDSGSRTVRVSSVIVTGEVERGLRDGGNSPAPFC